MKIWVDDVRFPPTSEYKWVKSVTDAKDSIMVIELHKQAGFNSEIIELIDIDHDAGDYMSDGGDYIRLLDWLEETGRSYPIRLHSQNPVGVANMRRIIERNGWKEVF